MRGGREAEETARAGHAEAAPPAVAEAPPVAMDLEMARTIGNAAFCSAIGRTRNRPVVARDTAPAGTAAPAQQSPEERIVNMRSPLADTIFGDAATHGAQAQAILREFCAPRNRWVSYVMVDSTGGPKVKPLITLTPQQRALRLPGPENGKVPLIFDPSFFTTLTVPTFQDRVRDVQTALLEILEWRIDNAAIDAQDLQDPVVEGRLRDLRASDAGSRRLRQLQQGTSDAAVRAHIDQILAYSTALPHDAAIGTSSTTVRIGTTDVTILPDARGGTKNETAYTPNPRNININATTRNGQVTAFTGVPASFGITIQTTYATATGDPETTTSAYGRGTTTDDQAAGNTSLRFHEGRHGADFLEYLNNNPRPLFQGTVGMTTQQFRQEMTDYLDAHRAWLEGMDSYSTRQTDCVGTVTIDDHHQGQAGYQLQCTP